MKNIKRIQDALRNKGYIQNPHGAAEDQAILAGEYSFLCSQLEEILMGKPNWWNLKRATFKSDTACEKAWQETPNGLLETGLRLRMKGIEKMMSALKSLIRMAEAEMNNI